MPSRQPSSASSASFVVPSRLVLQQWQLEMQAIKRTREKESKAWRRRLAKLNHDHNVLASKIRDGWSSRTPIIPIDVIQCIVDYLHHEPSEFLSALYLVSRNWLSPARQVLYRSIRLHYMKTDKFVATVRQTPSIRPYVHLLDVEIEAFKESDYLLLLPNCEVHLNVDLQYKDHEIFRTVWTSLLNVRELKRVVINASDDEDEDEGEGRYGARNLDFYSSRLLEFQGAQHWHHLESLELYSYNFNDNRIPFQKHFPNIYFTSLKTLKFINCQGVILPDTPRNTLRLLLLSNSGLVDAPSYISLVKLSADSIRDITFMHSLSPFIASRNKFTFDSVVSEMKAVQRVTLAIPSNFITPKFFNNLPPTVTYLSLLSYPRGFSSVNIADYLQRMQSSPNSLQTLIIKSATGDAEEWEEVHGIARGMGIEFSVE
jgi:hypothetical protein